MNNKKVELTSTFQVSQQRKYGMIDKCSELKKSLMENFKYSKEIQEVSNEYAYVFILEMKVIPRLQAKI
jgi:hypothetical protein